MSVLHYVDVPSSVSLADVEGAVTKLMEAGEIAAVVDVQVQGRRVRLRSSGPGQVQKAVEYFSECLYKVATGSPLPETENPFESQPDPEPATFEPAVSPLDQVITEGLVLDALAEGESTDG